MTALLACFVATPACPDRGVWINGSSKNHVGEAKLGRG